MSTLAERLERDGVVPWPEAAALLRGAAQSLDRPHLGLDPSRVLIDDDGRIRLDGAGRPGSPAYASPERARGEKNLDVRADLYALGVMLYEMLLGLPPYVGNDADVLRRHAEGRIKWELEDVPPGLLEIGRYLTEPDREARLPSPAALIQSIDALLNPPAAPAAPAAPRSGSRALVYGVGCLGIVFSIGFVVAGGVLAARKKPAERPKPVVKITVPPLKLPPPPKPLPPPPPPLPTLPPPTTPTPPPVPPPPPASPTEIEAYLPQADALAAVRDYDRIRAEAPPGAWMSEAMEPYRLAANLVTGARGQLDRMVGRTVSFYLRNPKGQSFGKLEAVEGDILRVYGTEIPWSRLSAQTLTSLYLGTGRHRDEEIFHFAVLDGDLPLAREAASDVSPSGRTARRFEELQKAAAEEAARTKRERDGDLALREAQRAHKSYKPEFYRDVLEFHPGTKAAESATEALAKLRTSTVRWGFNAGGTTEGWTGELVPGGRWNRKGFHLKGLQFEREGGFTWSPTARFRFDVRSRASKLTIRLDGEGRQASIETPHKASSLWAGVDVPLADFKTEGAWPGGAAVRKIRIEGDVADFAIDNVEIYEAGTE